MQRSLFSLLFISGSNQSVSTDNLSLQKRVFCRLLKKKTCQATDHLDNLGMLIQSSVYSFLLYESCVVNPVRSPILQPLNIHSSQTATEILRRGETPASFPVVLGDFRCDVTRQACRENSPRTQRHSVPSLLW